MRYFVRMDRLKEEGANLRTFADESVYQKVDHLKKIKTEMEWNSPAGEAFYDVYDSLINNLYDIGLVIEKLGSFMEYCSEHYTDANKEVIGEWVELIDDIERERLKNRI